MTTQTHNTTLGLLGVSARSYVQQALFVIAGSLVLALSSKLSVPMIPVPITMQTFAVTMVGALYGWRLGTLTVMFWLGQAMLGLPVLAGAQSSLLSFVGPTAGYLASFPIMAALVGYVTEKGIGGERPVAGFMLHLAANALGLVMGWMWLTTLMGSEKAWIVGVAPFILGAVLKSALAASVLKAVSLRSERRR